MNITNKYNLPREIVSWLERDDYLHESGVISATGIMKPVRAVVLQRRHGNELSTDISSFIASRYGTAIHDSFEAIKSELSMQGIVQEQRVYATVGSYKISGKFDMLKTLPDGTKILQDIKSTSVWKYVKNQELTDYVTQLSIYRWLLHENGIEISDRANIIFFFTDWSRSGARKSPDTYPPLRIAIKDIQLWTMEGTEDYVKERLALFDAVKDVPDNELPECTTEELWQDDREFKAIKKGGLKASKVFVNDEAGARAYLAEKGPEYELKIEGGLIKRCPDYCPCWCVCNQYARMKAEGIVDPAGE